MTTWDETRSDLRARFALLHDEPTWCGRRWRVATLEIDQRVELVELAGDPWIQIVTDVDHPTAIDPTTALARNVTLSMGALALENGRYKLRCALPLDGLSLDKLATWMEMMAHEAGRLRRAPRKAQDRAVFAHWTD
jgi:hypothetical protein